MDGIVIEMDCNFINRNIYYFNVIVLVKFFFFFSFLIVKCCDIILNVKLNINNY